MPRFFLFLLLVLPVAFAQSPPHPEVTNPAVIVYFRQGGHNRLAHFTELLRYPVEGGQDLLLVWGGVQAPAWAGRGLWWNQTDVMGLFFEERDHPERVHLLNLLLNDSRSCVVEVARIASGELTLGRTEEKGNRLENVKLFFDPRSRRLLRQIEYPPFRVVHIVPENGVPHLIANDGKQFLVIRPLSDNLPAGNAGFEILPDSAAAPLLARLPIAVSSTPREQFRSLDHQALLKPVRFGPGGRFVLDPEDNQSWGKIWRTITEQPGGRGRPFALPQSTCAQYAEARAKAIRRAFPTVTQGRTVCEGHAPEILETIGPRQIVDDRLWFGKTFYDAEGSVGVGGFGYFDPSERKFTIFSPPEIRDWSASALFAEADAVWVGLERRGEYGNSPGGLLRWDRTSHEVKRYDVNSIIYEMARYREALYLATDDGITVLNGDRTQQYIVDAAQSGGYHVVAR